MSEQPEALRLADELESFRSSSHRTSDGAPMHLAIAAELRRLHDELKECQAQRRAAFRRIEELDRELDAMRAQIGRGEPVAWLNKSGHVQVRAPYLSDEAVNAYSTNGQWTPLYAHPAPQQKPSKA